jgi:alpha-tubulin suppressor-like RCC1 family protein
MKHKSQRLKSILTAMTITFVAVFSILAFQATARAAQPMVAVGESHTVGLKSDGTALAVGLNISGQCDVSSWTDIVQVAAFENYTVVLKSDGTAVAVGSNISGQCDVGSWTDIAQVAAGGNHAVGLKSDGTAVVVGNNDFGQCDVGSWTDIAQVAAGAVHTVGLKSAGSCWLLHYRRPEIRRYGCGGRKEW